MNKLMEAMVKIERDVDKVGIERDVDKVGVG